MEIINFYPDVSNVEYVVSDHYVECLVELKNGINTNGKARLETRTNVYGYNIPDILSAKADALDDALHNIRI